MPVGGAALSQHTRSMANERSRGGVRPRPSLISSPICRVARLASGRPAFACGDSSSHLQNGRRRRAASDEETESYATASVTPCGLPSRHNHDIPKLMGLHPNCVKAQSCISSKQHPMTQQSSQSQNSKQEVNKQATQQQTRNQAAKQQNQKQAAQQQIISPKSFRADGMWGPHTRNALRDFDKSRGMTYNGSLNHKTLAALRVSLNTNSGG
jgi:hypothetical protein